MASHAAQIRSALNTRPTPQDKGLTATLEVTAYDNGLVTVNRVPMGGQEVHRNDDLGLGLLAAMESIAAQLAEFNRLVKARRAGQQA